MCERDTQSRNHGERPRLVCSGIWGGIRNLDQEMGMGKVIASLYSSSSDGGKGGDIYFFGVCRGCRITRLAIADVVGHGQAVSDVSQYVYDALTAHICDVDSRAILSDINQLVARRGLAAMTTAATVAYYADDGEVRLSYAGHPPVLFKRRTENTWSFATPNTDTEADGPLKDLPLAVAPDALYGELGMPMASGDRLFVYTDGVTEAPSPERDLFGGGRLKRVLDDNPDLPLAGVKSAVLHALRQHTDSELVHDDVTFITLEIS